MQITIRDVPPRSAWALEQAGVHPLLARLYAGRGITAAAQLDDSLAALQAPSLDEELLDIIDAISPAVKSDDAEA